MFKMPSTLLHLAWIRQLAVRWLNPPVVDVLGRGADHSSIEGLTTLTLLAGAMSPFPYCSDGGELCFLCALLSLSILCSL
ncbi:hypothetical protein B0H13DRAFT_2311318 [Mycena leptocephala]|nr:hypothetical protein B0H13DRAFT_2311318 [Mycena leptocephala]